MLKSSPCEENSTTILQKIIALCEEEEGKKENETDESSNNSYSEYEESTDGASSCTEEEKDVHEYNTLVKKKLIKSIKRKKANNNRKKRPKDKESPRKTVKRIEQDLEKKFYYITKKLYQLFLKIFELRELKKIAKNKYLHSLLIKAEKEYSELADKLNEKIEKVTIRLNILKKSYKEKKTSLHNLINEIEEKLRSYNLYFILKDIEKDMDKNHWKTHRTYERAWWDKDNKYIASYQINPTTLTFHGFGITNELLEIIFAFYSRYIENVQYKHQPHISLDFDYNLITKVNFDYLIKKYIKKIFPFFIDVSMKKNKITFFKSTSLKLRKANLGCNEINKLDITSKVLIQLYAPNNHLNEKNFRLNAPILIEADLSGNSFEKPIISDFSNFLKTLRLSKNSIIKIKPTKNSSLKLIKIIKKEMPILEKYALTIQKILEKEICDTQKKLEEKISQDNVWTNELSVFALKLENLKQDSFKLYCMNEKIDILKRKALLLNLNTLTLDKNNINEFQFPNLFYLSNLITLSIHSNPHLQKISFTCKDISEQIKSKQSQKQCKKTQIKKEKIKTMQYDGENKLESNDLKLLICFFSYAINNFEKKLKPFGITIGKESLQYRINYFDSDNYYCNEKYKKLTNPLQLLDKAFEGKLSTHSSLFFYSHKFSIYKKEKYIDIEKQIMKKITAEKLNHFSTLEKFKFTLEQLVLCSSLNTLNHNNLCNSSYSYNPTYSIPKFFHLEYLIISRSKHLNGFISPEQIISFFPYLTEIATDPSTDPVRDFCDPISFSLAVNSGKLPSIKGKSETFNDRFTPKLCISTIQSFLCCNTLLDCANNKFFSEAIYNYFHGRNHDENKSIYVKAQEKKKSFQKVFLIFEEPSNNISILHKKAEDDEESEGEEEEEKSKTVKAKDKTPPKRKAIFNSKNHKKALSFARKYFCEHLFYVNQPHGLIDNLFKNFVHYVIYGKNRDNSSSAKYYKEGDFFKRTKNYTFDNFSSWIHNLEHSTKINIINTFLNYTNKKVYSFYCENPNKFREHSLTNNDDNLKNKFYRSSLKYSKEVKKMLPHSFFDQINHSPSNNPYLSPCFCEKKINVLLSKNESYIKLKLKLMLYDNDFQQLVSETFEKDDIFTLNKLLIIMVYSLRHLNTYYTRKIQSKKKQLKLKPKTRPKDSFLDAYISNVIIYDNAPPNSHNIFVEYYNYYRMIPHFTFNNLYQTSKLEYEHLYIQSYDKEKENNDEKMNVLKEKTKESLNILEKKHIIFKFNKKFDEKKKDKYTI